MVGAVGDDAAGGSLVAGLTADGVDVRFVSRSAPGVPTGTAVCLVGDDGAGAIVVVAGANGEVSAAGPRRPRPCWARPTSCSRRARCWSMPRCGPPS